MLTWQLSNSVSQSTNLLVSSTFCSGEEAQGRRSTILLQQSSCQLKFEGAVLIEYAVSEEPEVLHAQLFHESQQIMLLPYECIGKKHLGIFPSSSTDLLLSFPGESTCNSHR